MNALYFEEFGGPDVLRYGPIADPIARDGETILRTSAIGLNFADIYRRRGNYHIAGAPPYIAGYEAVGYDPVNGSRFGFADSPFANAERVAVPNDHLIPIPVDISDDVAATLLLQGLTACYALTAGTHRIFSCAG